MTKNEDLKELVRTVPDWPKPGIQFRDVSTLLLDGTGFRNAINRLAAHVPEDTELVAGIEARGFIVASALGYALGLGKLMLRKAGKLPGGSIGVDYSLEYGTDRIEMHEGAVKQGQKVVLVDDLLATGGTAIAATQLLRTAGADLNHALFLIDLPALGGADRLRAQTVEPISLMSFEGD